MITYIIGHRKPDLDAVVAAISVAAFRKLRGDTNPVAAISDPINPETEFVFKKFSVTPPPQITAANIEAEDKVVLVDHNETDQRLEGLNESNISAVIDHHKVNLNLPNPIKIMVMPVGSTNTIVYLKFKQYGFQIEPQLASIMLCAVLSDTVGLKSSTTTDKDKEAVEALAKIANISDINALTFEIFKAKSNLTALTDEQIVKNDFKIFQFKAKTFIGQIETVQQHVLLDTRKPQLLAAMQQIKSTEGVDYLYLAVTDILNVNTKLLFITPAEESLAVKAFGGTPMNNVLDIGPKMSRKKDIAPAIEKSF